FSELQRLLPRSGPWLKFVKYIFALSFFGLAIFYLRPFLSERAIWRWIGLLLIVTAIPSDLLSPHLRREIRSHIKVKLVNRVALWSAIMGRIWLVPGRRVWLKDVNEPAIHVNSDWSTYSEGAIEEARTRHQPVIIDFFADWCAACKELDQ